ncbi:MAG: glycosyltransferase [Methyloversatilis sp.]|jgi:glycosyltransferase involved in cell wall biosynthesis|nr:glycosyltransferase [Methyloversatilis sp.]
MKAKTQKNKDKIEVVICTHNRAESLETAISSIISEIKRGQIDIDIHVVLNSCTDDSEKKLLKLQTALENRESSLSWSHEKRKGKSHALNHAINRSNADVLCFIDDDQIILDGFIKAIKDAIEKNPEVEIFCGKITPAWDGREPRWVHLQEPYRIPIRPFPEFDLGNMSRTLSKSDQHPSGGNMVVRKSLFMKIGKFNTSLGPTGHNLHGGEDQEFLARATTSGAKILYIPEAKQLHEVDLKRTKFFYTVKKSFLRTRSNLAQTPPPKPSPYMLRKLAIYACKMLTPNPSHRLFFAVKFAATLGELTASLETLRQWKKT